MQRATFALNMPELRYNPMLGTYTMVAANRQARPQMPKDYCPFDEGSGRVPDHYDVYPYPNDFPALSTAFTEPETAPQGPYAAAPAYGACEVILFSPDHNGNLHDLPDAHLAKLVDLWAERYAKYAADPRVKYVFEFENRGEEVGVTMPHPHGQLYGYPFVPLKLEVEFAQARAHYQRTGSDLVGDMTVEERRDGRRILAENDHFIAYLPYFTDYPYGAFVVAKRLVGSIPEMDAAERLALGQMLRTVTGGMDKLFDRRFPYMMCLHALPCNAPEWADAASYYRFHVEFYPPLRDATRIKYYAGSEMGAWAAANTRAVEETALEFKSAIARFEAERLAQAPIL